ncbi:MAG: hypothetical protein ACXWWN_04655, partial [Gemmatimonadales bacterium]
PATGQASLASMTRLTERLDVRRDRKVALKVLRPELAAAESPWRCTGTGCCSLGTRLFQATRFATDETL